MIPRRLRIVVILVGLLVVAVPDVGGVQPAPVELPLTLERIWCRTATQSAFGKVFKSAGDLTVTEDGLEFVTRKKTLRFPMDQIRQISFGKMRGDVDTEWALLAMGEGAPKEFVGFRDGSKLGYGGRTREIFERIRSVARSLGIAQYDSPPGYRTFEGMESQCFLAIPEEWDVHAESLTVVDGRSSWGTLVFSSEPTTTGEGAGRVTDEKLLGRVRAGEVVAFFVDRSEARKGMACEGMTPKARKEVLRRVSDHPVFGNGYETRGDPTVESAVVDGCEGMRILVSGEDPDGKTMVVEVVAVARADTLFLFGFKARAERRAEYRKPFEASLATIEFALGRP